MKKTYLWITIVIIVVVAVVGMIIFAMSPSPSAGTNTSTTAVNYSCANGATIAAQYSSSSVALTLSDGRSLTLPQAQSGSGVRYEAGSGTSDDIVFSSEGANASLTENGSTTFSDCIAANLQTSGNGSTTSFTDQGNTFAFDYPSQFTVTGNGAGYTQQWMYNATTSGLILAQLSIPSSLQPNTNFAGAKLTVGTSPDSSAVSTCLTEDNPSNASTTEVTINGTHFAKVTYGDAGAGNFYNITSYRTVRNNQCYAVEYVIHSTDIGNYPPSANISLFNEGRIQNILEGVVQSFRFLQ